MPDSEYTDSEYESDYEEEYNNNITYEPEEPCATRFNISVCELYNETIHGDANNLDVLYHYLVYERYKKLDIEYINGTTNFVKNQHTELLNENHNIFRNYREIIQNDNYIKPELTECFYLETGHCIAIVKTHWIKLIQRTWKNILKKRENINKKRSHPISLFQREITGKWPRDCCFYPTLKGMLSNII
jgi:hypothetical protein